MTVRVLKDWLCWDPEDTVHTPRPIRAIRRSGIVCVEQHSEWTSIWYAGGADLDLVELALPYEDVMKILTQADADHPDLEALLQLALVGLDVMKERQQ